MQLGCVLRFCRALRVLKNPKSYNISPNFGKPPTDGSIWLVGFGDIGFKAR